MKVTGFDLAFRLPGLLALLWALGGEEARRAVEAAHERAVAAVLARIEGEAAIIRVGAQGVYMVRPLHGLVAAWFRHYEARSGMPLLHGHLLLSVRALRPGGKWGSVRSEVLYEHVVAASALYIELVMAEARQALELTAEQLGRLQRVGGDGAPASAGAAGRVPGRQRCAAHGPRGRPPSAPAVSARFRPSSRRAPMKVSGPEVSVAGVAEPGRQRLVLAPYAGRDVLARRVARPGDRAVASGRLR